jgi:hypothetical protein
MEYSNGIKRKGKIGQLLCRHKNKEWFVEKGQMFFSLRGETRYHICKDCGKQLGSYLAEYEGNGFK